MTFEIIYGNFSFIAIRKLSVMQLFQVNNRSMKINLLSILTLTNLTLNNVHVQKRANMIVGMVFLKISWHIFVFIIINHCQSAAWWRPRLHLWWSWAFCSHCGPTNFTILLIYGVFGFCIIIRYLQMVEHAFVISIIIRTMYPVKTMFSAAQVPPLAP